MRILLASIAILAVVGLVVIGTKWSTKQPYQQTNQSTSEKSQTETPQHDNPESWGEWFSFMGQRIWSDPNIFFACAVACFSGLLVAVTILLFISAEHSADAAKKSADIAERALISGQRAFISVGFRHTAVLNPKTGKITHWAFTAVWTNSGNTPTRNMKNHSSLMLFEKTISTDWDFPDLWSATIPQEQRLPIPMGVSPKNSGDGQTIAVPVEILNEVIEGKKFLYLWGVAGYNDVFPNTARHITRFAVRISVGGNPLDKDHISFYYENLPKYNCSDDECGHQGYPADWKPREMVVE